MAEQVEASGDTVPASEGPEAASPDALDDAKQPKQGVVRDDDLEDGEIDDGDDEEDPRPTKEADASEVFEALPGESRHSHRSSSTDSDGRGDVGGETLRCSRHQKMEKKDKARRRERSKRSLKEELRSDEEKKRLIKEKLRALERQMGGNTDEEDDNDNLEGVDGYCETDVEHSPPRHYRASRKRKATDKEVDKGSLEHNPSDGKCDRVKSDKQGHASDQKEKRHKSKDICQLYMQGKCPRNPNQCHFSHDAVPPQIMELCKFYLFERCAKKDKCLYLHKDFPCKFYHTGLSCPDTAESCKFSHEPLNDITRKILLKHLETAPSEILGDFPRYNRESALAVVYQTEAKYKGWNSEEDNPEFNKKAVRSAGDNLIANSNQGDHLFQQSSQNGSDKIEDQRRISRWDKPSIRPCLPPPILLQGLSSMFGHKSGRGLLGPCPGPLLPHPPFLTLKINPIIIAPPKQSFPPGYGEDQLSEEQISNFLKAQKMASQIKHQKTGSNQVLHLQTTENKRDLNKENDFEENCPNEQDLMDSTGFMKPLKPQRSLFDQIRQAQAIANEEAKPLQATNCTRNPNPNSLKADHGFNNDESCDNSFSQNEDGNWYSSVVENHSKETITHRDKKVRTSPKGFPMPSFEKDEKPDTFFDSGAKEESQDCCDPRRNRDPRVSKPPLIETKEFLSTRIPSTSAFKSEVDKDQKILEMDLSILGELELPAFKDHTTDEDSDSEQERLGLPFKPHQNHSAVQEIDASIHAHPLFEYKLTPIPIFKLDYSCLAGLFTISRIQQDPRLRRYAKKGLFRLDSSPQSYKQTSEPAAKEDRPSNPRRNITCHKAPKHLETPTMYSPTNDLHSTRTTGSHGQSNNFDTGYQNRSGGLPQDDGYRHQDTNNSSGQRGSGRGQDQWSDPRGNREHAFGRGIYQSQPYHRSFDSFPQGGGSGRVHRGARGVSQRYTDPRSQRDPRYQKC